jgi:hypothetical protein
MAKKWHCRLIKTEGSAKLLTFKEQSLSRCSIRTVHGLIIWWFPGDQKKHGLSPVRRLLDLLRLKEDSPFKSWRETRALRIPIESKGPLLETRRLWAKVEKLERADVSVLPHLQWLLPAISCLPRRSSLLRGYQSNHQKVHAHQFCLYPLMWRSASIRLRKTIECWCRLILQRIGQARNSF